MILDSGPKQRTSPWELAVAQPPEQWDDWTELSSWPGHDSRTNVCSASERLV